jgi:hypothetical protein
VANKVLEVGSDLESDHPGFRDESKVLMMITMMMMTMMMLMMKVMI